MGDDHEEKVGLLSDKELLGETPVLIELVCELLSKLVLHSLPIVVKAVEVEVGEESCIQQQGAHL